jgi:large subunit ribosomal protein L29
MKVKEINELETKDLNEKLEQAVAQLRQTKLNHQISPLEDSSKLKAMRRDIARMKTVLRQRELNK